MFKQTRKVISVFILVCFFISSINSPVFAQTAQQEMMLLHLPVPGVMVHLSPYFNPAMLKGITVHPENPFQFDFIVDQGDNRIPSDQKKEAYQKLVKYFLASLTTPEKDLWVNLSPYEKDRIIPDVFGKTEMGRDLLAQDYLLKQITASLIYPEDEFGRKFWREIYSQAVKEFGTTDIPVNTFNKVWIIPDQATVYENGNTAYVLKSHLKVMLEEDYLSLDKHSAVLSQSNKTHEIGSQVVREIVLPELEKEVNEGKNFALLRQVNSSLILATWFKKRLKESVLGRIYVDKGKVKGVDQDPRNNQKIYQRYLSAFKKGVFNYIKEEAIGVPGMSSKEQGIFPRKYFSGGWSASDGEHSFAETVIVEPKRELSKGDEEILVNAAQKAGLEIATVNLEDFSVNAAMQSNQIDDVSTGLVKISDIKIPSDLELKEKEEGAVALFNELIRKQLMSELLGKKVKASKEDIRAINAAIKNNESEFVRRLLFYAREYYESQEWKTESNSGNRGVFQKTNEAFSEALRNNGFYQSMYFNQLISECFEFTLTAKEGSSRIDLDFNSSEIQSTLKKTEFNDLRAKIVDFMGITIDAFLDDFRQGKVELPELGINKRKQNTLKLRSLILPIITMVGLTYLAQGYLSPYVVEFLKASEKLAHWPDTPEKVNYFGELLIMGILEFKGIHKIRDIVGERSKGSFERYNEEAMYKYIYGGTPENKQRWSNDFERFFGDLKGYFFEKNRDRVEISLLTQLEGYLRTGLNKLDRYRRAGYNIEHVVRINQAFDRISGDRKPLISKNAVIIIMLKELSDQNPEYLKSLEGKWRKDQKRRDSIWRFSKKKPSIAADIFLKALAYVKNMDEGYEILLDEETEQAFINNGHGYFDFQKDSKRAQLMGRSSIDRKYLQILFRKIRNDNSIGLEDKGDIITSRFFSGALSRLWQISGSVSISEFSGQILKNLRDNGYVLPVESDATRVRVKPDINLKDPNLIRIAGKELSILQRAHDRGTNVPPGYKERLLVNTDELIKILNSMLPNSPRQRIRSHSYGLTDEQVQYMKIALEDARKMVKEFSEKSTVGGIDLNPANQNLLIQGQGNSFALPDRFKNLDAAQINGFSPIVVSIRPIADLHKMLGIDGLRP